MTHTQYQVLPGWREGLLSGAAVIVFGLGGAAMAQPGASAHQQGQGAQAQTVQAPSQQPGSQAPAVVGQLRTAEHALRQAHGQVTGAQQLNLMQARTAVDAGMNVLTRVPQQVQGQEPWRSAQRELDEARRALQGDQPDQQRAATQLREAADAVGALAGQMGGSADASGTGGSGTGGQQRASTLPAQPQVNVQQQAPRITVQQQEPRITVTQPPPQVVIQQAPPQVNIQRPEPRVTVQTAQPQVTVQQGGQPQVTVQRQGEPQVTVQGQDGQRRDVPQAQANADHRSGASSATPAPAQSGGGRAQPAAATQAAGMALQSVQSLVGTNVVGANGRDAGEVRNLLLDAEGRVRGAVVEWGGFLGIGTREALVPIERIRLGQGNEQAQLAMTREELEALPRYDRDRIGAYGRERGWGEGLRLFR